MHEKKKEKRKADEQAMETSSTLSSSIPHADKQSHLFKRICIEQYPSHFNDFGGVLCDINSMLIASGGDMDDHISVQLRQRRRMGHDDKWPECEPNGTNRGRIS